MLAVLHTQAAPKKQGAHRAVQPKATKRHDAPTSSMKAHYNTGKPVQMQVQQPISDGIVQRTAFETTRPLGQGTPVGTFGPLPQDMRQIRHNLNIEHRHIIFNNAQALPVVGNSNNIGFHSATGGVRGQGALFTEGIAGHTIRRPLSTNAEDPLLVQAITNVGTNGRFARYNLLTTNCQDWVDAVIGNFNALKAAANTGTPDVAKRGRTS